MCGVFDEFIDDGLVVVNFGKVECGGGELVFEEVCVGGGGGVVDCGEE